jgi:hypothetical protein
VNEAIDITNIEKRNLKWSYLSFKGQTVDSNLDTNLVLPGELFEFSVILLLNHNDLNNI